MYIFNFDRMQRESGRVADIAESEPSREFIVPLKFIVNEREVTRCQSMNKQRQVVLVSFSSTRLIQLLCLSLPVDCTMHSVNNIDIGGYEVTLWS